MSQSTEATPERYAFVRKVSLPSFTACWAAPSAFLTESGQNRFSVSEPMPNECESLTQESKIRVGTLNRDLRPHRCSETWKISSDHMATVYVDTEAGTIQYVLSREASRVWLDCDGTKNMSTILAECDEDDLAIKYIVAFLKEGLLLCQPENPSFS